MAKSINLYKVPKFRKTFDIHRWTVYNIFTFIQEFGKYLFS